MEKIQEGQEKTEDKKGEKVKSMEKDEENQKKTWERKETKFKTRKLQLQESDMSE